MAALTTNSMDQLAGVEFEFLETPPAQIVIQTNCSICCLTLHDPCKVSCCEQNFCRNCIEQIKRDRNACPNCKKGSFSYFQNEKLRQILYLELCGYCIYCTQKQQGCTWEGEWGQLNEHLNLNPRPDEQLQGCQYCKIQCLYCSELVLRSTLGEHHCPESVPLSTEYEHLSHMPSINDIATDHRAGNFVECTNECGNFLQPQNMDAHLQNNCPLTVIKCNFHHIGCDVEIPRRDMQAHLQEGLVKHVSLQASSHITQQREILDLRRNVTALENENKSLKSHVRNLQQNVEQKIVELEQNTKVHTTEYNQLQQEIVRMRKELQPCFCIPISSCVEFVMHNFDRLRKEDDRWRSPRFFTNAVNGYKLCLVVYSNGFGAGYGSYVSVFILLMEGPCDSNLSWPFRGMITIKLINKNRLSDDHYSCSTTITIDENSETHADNEIHRIGKNEKFISFEELKRDYLVNNSLCFQISEVKLLAP